MINEKILNAIHSNGQKYVVDNWGVIGDLDKMTGYLIEKSGKIVKEIKIYKTVEDMEDIYMIWKIYIGYTINTTIKGKK